MLIFFAHQFHMMILFVRWIYQSIRNRFLRQFSDIYWLPLNCSFSCWHKPTHCHHSISKSYINHRLYKTSTSKCFDHKSLQHSQRVNWERIATRNQLMFNVINSDWWRSSGWRWKCHCIDHWIRRLELLVFVFLSPFEISFDSI